MKVYAAECVWYYEGNSILGIFTTPEKAKEVGNYRRNHYPDGGQRPYVLGDELKVTEWEVKE